MTFAKTVAAVATATVAFVALAGTAEAAPVVVGSYYQEQVNVTCNNLSSCEALFTAVPAGKTLIVTDVSCVASYTNTRAMAAVSMAGRQSNNALVQRTVYPIGEQISDVSGMRRYQVMAETNHILLATEKARVFLGLNGVAADFNAICTIAGDLL